MSNKSKAKWIILLAVVMMVLSGLGCVDGDDIQGAGQAVVNTVQDAAQDVSNAVGGLKDAAEQSKGAACEAGIADPGGCIFGSFAP